MIKIKFLVVFLCAIFSVHFHSYSQSKAFKNENKGQANLGIGLGTSYGGIGGRVTYNVSEQFGLFLGAGTMIAGMGYNVGTMIYIPSKSRVQGYFSIMYGVNSAIIVEGHSEYTKVYTGASIALGIKLRSRKSPGNYWDFGLVIPFKSSEYEDDLYRVKFLSGTELKEPNPVLITVGYNFLLN